MTAKELVGSLGGDLKGCVVLTCSFGAWPGGLARVTEIAPDANAPEIVFEVSGAANPRVQEAIRRGDLDDERIGVFADEEVELIAAPQQAAMFRF